MYRNIHIHINQIITCIYLIQLWVWPYFTKTQTCIWTQVRMALVWGCSREKRREWLLRLERVSLERIRTLAIPLARFYWLLRRCSACSFSSCQTGTQTLFLMGALREGSLSMQLQVLPSSHQWRMEGFQVLGCDRFTELLLLIAP